MECGRNIEAEQLAIARKGLAFLAEAGAGEREPGDLSSALRDFDTPLLVRIPQDVRPHLVKVLAVLLCEGLIRKQMRVCLPPRGHVQLSYLVCVG